MPCCWHPTLGVDCACYLLVACHLSVAAECARAFLFILACWVQPGAPIYSFIWQPAAARLWWRCVPSLLFHCLSSRYPRLQDGAGFVAIVTVTPLLYSMCTHPGTANTIVCDGAAAHHKQVFT